MQQNVRKWVSAVQACCEECLEGLRKVSASGHSFIMMDHCSVCINSVPGPFKRAILGSNNSWIGTINPPCVNCIVDFIKNNKEVSCLLEVCEVCREAICGPFIPAFVSYEVVKRTNSSFLLSQPYQASPLALHFSDTSGSSVLLDLGLVDPEHEAAGYEG